MKKLVCWGDGKLKIGIECSLPVFCILAEMKGLKLGWRIVGVRLWNVTVGNFEGGSDGEGLNVGGVFGAS